MVSIKWPPELRSTRTGLEVDRVERAGGPTGVPDAWVSQRAAEGANPRFIQLENWVAVALTAALLLEASINVLSARFQEADTNATVGKFNSDGDPSRPSSDDAEIGDD